MYLKTLKGSMCPREDPISCPLSLHSSLLKNNVGRFFFLHTSIRVDITACFGQQVACSLSPCVKLPLSYIYHMQIMSGDKRKSPMLQALAISMTSATSQLEAG